MAFDASECEAAEERDGMKTYEQWFSELPKGGGDSYDVSFLQKKHIEAIQLDSYRAGMLKAASLKANWHITEQEGVSALKREIREFAAAINTISEP